MFEAIFTFILSFQFGAGLVAGAFIGIGLARRSSTANKFYDDARARWDETEQRLRARIRELEGRLGKD